MSSEPPRPSFAALSNETLLAICEHLDGDGHGILYPDFLRELHVPDEYIASVTERYTSDGTHKGSIYPPDSAGLPGQPILGELQGVYSLALYERIGFDLGLPGSPYNGRGFMARDWDRRIREHLATRNA